MQGKGIVTDGEGKVIFEGMWTNNIGYAGTTDADGKPHGRGDQITETGDIYAGDWVNGKKEGYGEI
ncbi:hypothetical protein AGMMS49949_08780 [Alphaproteobacteria bacterium]|nr:hypothetical protein AGMMS49949_08780 [Alphaproteobacteria bacterium]GHS99928.1 hypothetical protein AGMMS50296_8190 [Alphaproteobacteria bacterium]